MTTSVHAAPTLPADDGLWSLREAWSREEREAFQLAALRSQLRYLHDSSEFYRRRLDAIGWRSDSLRSLADLGRLPTTSKQEYVQSLRARAPWGEALAAPKDSIHRVHFSSGTTSQPAPMFWTKPDLDRWADLYARAAYSQGVRASDTYQCLFNFSWFVGGLGAMSGYQRLGCACIPGGSSDSKRQLETILRFGVTVVGGTPSFLLHLAEIAEAEAIDLASSAVRIVMTGGEPGASLPGVRQQLERLWGAKVYDGYGSIEFQPTAWECAAQSGNHLFDDFVYTEVVDAQTKEPVADGTPGVLVLTHLDKQAAPLLRWWTGDIVVRDQTPCSCGRTSSRLIGGVRGRSDDMLVIKGVNLFPSAVEDLIRRTLPDAGEFRIIADESLRDPTTGFLSAIRVQVEVRDTLAAASERLAAQIRQDLRVRAIVEPLDLGSLDRSNHKSNRLVRA